MRDESLAVSELSDPIGMCGTLCVWWRFFWRYVVSWASLLLLGGYLLNLLSGIMLDSRFLFSITLIYSSAANATASLVIFFYILNRPFKKSNTILSTRSDLPVLRTKLRVWFHYYWRFLLFSFGFALLLGALLPLAARWLGQDPLAYLKYSKYIGNVSMIPASLLAFWLLLRRRGQKRLLLISTCSC